MFWIVCVGIRFNTSFDDLQARNQMDAIELTYGDEFCDVYCQGGGGQPIETTMFSI